MSEKQWTDAQKLSIYENGKNILVSAAAGSGKTAVLVERVINMLTRDENPVPVNRLLVVTFTNAAANEMQMRIREALKKKSEAEPKNRLVKKQLSLLPGANINTFHSFCQNLIKNNFYELSISPNFKIGDATKLEMLANEALETVMEKYYSEKSDGIKYLYASFSGKYNDEKLLGIIKGIYNFSKSTPEPDKWLKKSVDNFVSGNIWKDYILSLKDELADVLISLAEEALEFAENGAENYINSLNCDLEQFIKFKNLKKDWDVINAFVSELSLTPLARKKKTDDEACVTAVKKIRDTINKKYLGKLIHLFSNSTEEINEDNQILFEAAKILCDIVLDFDVEFSKLKMDSNLVDFNDLEHLALKLIKNKPSVKDSYDEILIDEFQDTNGVQNAIVEALSNGHNLFMVGDVKQSIYGFRNARPDIFLEKEKSFNSEDTNSIEIFLSHNFRSASDVIDFINLVFSKIMTPGFGGIDYNKGHSLVYGGFVNSSFKNVAELHVINKNVENEDELTDEELEFDDITREAIFIAREILKNVKSGLCKFSDIAVLTRESKRSSPIFASVFASYDIPYYSTTETGNYLVTPEISTVVSMLQILDNPLQDIPLTAVLKSPMFLFTDEELAFIKSKNVRSLYHAIKETDSEKCRFFLDKFSEYRNISNQESIEYLIRYILFDTGYYSAMGAMPNGSVRTVNLMLLCERAREFESNNAKSLFDFINYLEFMKTTENKYSSAETNGENDDAVKITTIHKSKGLEFPFVFVARCGNRFNKSDISADILYDAELGIGFEFTDFEKNIKYPSLSKLAIAQKKENLLFAEELRIFYVALTRAKQKLVLVGTKTIKENTFANFENYKSIKECNSLLDFICYALGNRFNDFAKIHSAEEIVKSNRFEIEKTENSFTKSEKTDEISEEISQMLSYSYPFIDAKNIPSKIPVSRLIKKDDREITLSSPSFITDKDTISANIRGSAVHFILQNIDIHKTSSVKEIELQIENMVNSKILNKNFLRSGDISRIFNFFNSDIGQRMKKSENVQREAPFFAYIPASEIMEIENDTLKNEQVLLQGVVDCYFEENGSIILLDYKTGYNRPEYEEQLKFYAYGLEKVLNKKVTETHICMI